MSGGAMEEAVFLTTEGGGGANNNYCIWCLSNYGDDNANPRHPDRKREGQLKRKMEPDVEVVPDSNPNDSGDSCDEPLLWESYKERRHKLVLEYILQCDSIQDNEDQRRRHLLVQKLLESCQTEEVGVTGALYQLCPSCEDKADEVMKLHLELEAVQAKLLDKVSSLIDIIINNSMYGSNEDTKRRMQQLEMRLQQRHQHEDEERGGLEGDDSGDSKEVFKNYVDILQQFQTLIFEGGGKLRRNVPGAAGLQVRMPVSALSEEEGDSTIVCSIENVMGAGFFIGDENCPNTLATGIITKKKSPETSPKSKSGQKMPYYAKPKVDADTDEQQQQLQDQELLLTNVTQELPVYWDNLLVENCLESEIKNDPIEIDDVLPSTPPGHHQFQYPEDFEGPLPFSSQALPPSQETDHELIVPDQEDEDSPSPNMKLSRFSVDQQQSKTPRMMNRTSQLKKEHRLIKVTGAPKHLIKLIRPNRSRSKVIERQKLIRDNGKKKRREFPCSACSFVGTTPYGFVHHLREHETAEKVFVCKETDCEERLFSEKQFYDFHTKLHKNIICFSKCGICDLRFPPPSLTAHMKSHQTTIFPCSNCYFCTHNIKDFVYHLKHHLGSTTFDQLSCPLCPKLFQKQREVTSALVKHLYSDHGCTELLLKCEFKDCTKTFLAKAALTDHYNIHLNRFKCSSCEEAFKCNFALREHVQKVHLQLMKLFMCNVGDCLESFKNKSQLESHQVMCHGFPKYKCDLCIGCEYNNSYALRGHVGRVHNANSYVCVACGKNCSTIQALRRHETIHLEKNVFCDECDFVTKSRHQLKKHQNTVHRTAPMKHGCPHCPKRFNCKRAMEDHIRTHTGERPFVCEFCCQAFGKKQPMTNHIRKVHANDAVKVGPNTNMRNATVTATTSDELTNTSSTIYVALR